MSGTKEGAAKMVKALKERLGEDHFKKIGGMNKGVPRPGAGFASMSPERRRELGRKGGSNRGNGKRDE